MKAATFTSVLKRMNRNFKTMPHLHLAATGTITFSLLVAGLFLIVYTNINDLIDTWKADFRVVAYLKNSVSDKEGMYLRGRVSKIDGVASATYVSRQEALTRLQDRMKHRSSLLEGLQTNPLPASLEIEVSVSDPDESTIGKLVQELEAIPEIDEVEYARAWLRRFAGFVTFFRLATVIVGAVIFATTVFICSNTIRLTLYARREEVAVMQIIGATDSFIRAPYYLQNLLEGFLGAALAVGVLFGAHSLFTAKLATGGSLFFTAGIRFLSPLEVTGLIISGITMAWLGCHLALNQFTKS
jgi:cell division transport system permease protein